VTGFMGRHAGQNFVSPFKTRSDSFDNARENLHDQQRSVLSLLWENSALACIFPS